MQFSGAQSRRRAFSTALAALLLALATSLGGCGDSETSAFAPYVGRWVFDHDATLLRAKVEAETRGTSSDEDYRRFSGWLKDMAALPSVFEASDSGAVRYGGLEGDHHNWTLSGRLVQVTEEGRSVVLFDADDPAPDEALVSLVGRDLHLTVRRPAKTGFAFVFHRAM